MSINLESLFATIQVPPPVTDPTGGLLEPAIAPINFIVEKIEEAVLSAMTDGILAIRMVLGELTDGLKGTVDDAFKTIFQDSQAIINDAFDTLKKAIDDLQNGVTDVLDNAHNILNNIESMANDAINSASKYASDIKSGMLDAVQDIDKTVQNIVITTRQTISSTLEQELNSLTIQITTRANSITSSNNTAMTQISNSVNNSIQESAGAMDAVMHEAEAEIKNVFTTVNVTASGAISSLRAARIRASTTADTIASNAKYTISNLDPSADLEEVASRLRSSINITGLISLFINVFIFIIFITIIYFAFKVHFILIRPKMYEVAKETDLNFKKNNFNTSTYDDKIK